MMKRPQLAQERGARAARAARAARLGIGGILVAGTAAFVHPHPVSEVLTNTGNGFATVTSAAKVLPEPLLRSLVDVAACQAQGGTIYLARKLDAHAYQSKVPAVCRTATPEHLIGVATDTGVRGALGTAALLAAVALSRLRKRSPRNTTAATPDFLPATPSRTIEKRKPVGASRRL